MHFKLKVVLAAVLITGLLTFAAHQFLPTVGWLELGAGSLAAWLSAMAVAIVLVLLYMTFLQYLLRKGAIDPQWLWFAHDPAGLDAYRRKHRHTKRRS